MGKSLYGGKLLDGATVTGAGAAGTGTAGWKSYQAVVAGTGALTATIQIEGSNVPSPASTDWVILGTITLSGTTTATDGFANEAPYLKIRANLTAVTGTGATVNVHAAEF